MPDGLTIWIIMGAALVDSINPCVFGALIFLIAFMTKVFKNRTKMLIGGLLYTFVVYITYLFLGFGILKITIGTGFAGIFYLFAATVAILAGLLEIKDYFWYGRWFSLAIPATFAKKIHNYTSKTTVFGVILLGAFVSAVELPCTGAPYLAIITLLSQNFDFTAFLMLVLYNIIFVLPLIIILVLVASGMKLHQIKKWKQVSRPFMRLLIGILLVALGWMLILIANGTINLG